MSRKKIFSFGYLFAGIIFLCNPNFNLFDLLPDALGCLFLLLGFSGAADLCPHFSDANRYFKRLLWLSLVKIPCVFIMMAIYSVNNGERAIITVFALAFSVVEVLFAFPAFRALWEGFRYLGERDGLSAALSGWDGVRRLTSVFLIIKAAGSFLPELCLISVFETLGSLEPSAVNPVKYYFPALIGTAAVVLVCGVLWAIRVCRYLGNLRADEQVTEYCRAKEETFSDTLDEKRQAKIFGFSLLSLLFAVIATAELTFDDINYLPDTVAAVFFLGFFLLSGKSKGRLGGVIGTGVYGVLTVLSAVFRTSYFTEYDATDAAYNDRAASLYLRLEIVSVLETAAYLFVLFAVCCVLCGVIRERVGKPDSTLQRSFLRRTAAFGVMGALPGIFSCAVTFLSALTEKHIVSAAETNEYYTEGQVVYLPVFDAGWVLSFLLTLVFIGYGAWYLSSLREETREAED